MTRIIRQCTGTHAFWITATLTLASYAAMAFVTMTLVLLPASTRGSHRAVRLAAFVLELASLGAVSSSILLFLARSSRRAQTLSCAAFTMLALPAVALTLSLLLLSTRNGTTSSSSDVDDATVESRATAGFALCAASVIAPLLFYLVVFWPCSPSTHTLTAQDLASRLQEIRTAKRLSSLRKSAVSSARHSPNPDRNSHDAPVPPVSHFSSPSVSPSPSLRRSIIRPITSKTRLLLRPSRAPCNSLATPVQHDGFENWDTSAAKGTTVPATKPIVRTPLESIPGSRPITPAKPSDPTSSNQPSPAVQHPSPIAPALSIAYHPRPSFDLRPCPQSRRSSVHSAHVEEAYIHPLFRSESPIPPPLHSPGTVIVGAGGVPRRFHPAPGSQPASPNPLSPVSPLCSRQSSRRSATTAGSPMSGRRSEG